MSGFQHKPNKGTIFMNETYEANSKYGDAKTKYYTGSCDVNGTVYTLRAYIENTKGGLPILKLDFRPAETTA